MASTSKLTKDIIASYFAGDELSDRELEAELDQIDVESDEEELDTRFCSDDDDDLSGLKGKRFPYKDMSVRK